MSPLDLVKLEKDGYLRPPVSGSMAGHCRMEIYLAAHGYAKEEVQPGTHRTFDMGHIIEAAMFRTIRLIQVGDDGTLEEKVIGPWWDKNNPGWVGEVHDYATGQSFVADMSQLSGFQREVSFGGFKGHMDAFLTLDTGIWVPDVKSVAGYGYDRALTGDLYTDPFAREYVFQVLGYAKGLKDEGVENVKGGILIYFNKEQSQVCCRFVPYDAAIAAEGEERLSWARSDGEPEADWAWSRGSVLGSGKGNILRCGYCSFRQSCAQVRGFTLVQQFGKGNKPEWVVT